MVFSIDYGRVWTLHEIMIRAKLAMNREIQALLIDLEAKYGVEVLYACESGSRAWGFASPDSDYDIRFLYRHPIKDCYLVTSAPDSIEVPIENDLDPGGWELRKALRLLGKSNGALIEWLHSPIIYRANDVFLNEMRELAQATLSRRALVKHYRGMAHKVMETGLKKKSPTGKAYLYALRAALSAQHVLESGAPPPVEFKELLPYLQPKEREAVDGLLEWKKTANEKGSPGHLEVIDLFLKDSLECLTQACERLSPEEPEMGPLNEMLHRWTLWPDD